MIRGKGYSAAAITMLLLGVLTVSAAAQGSGDTGPVIGIFDSRCIAFAYYQSEEFMTKMNQQKADYETALQEGDSVLAEELGTLGPQMQQQAHEQVFSTGDIDEIISMIWSELPGVAEEAGVDIIVNSWDIIYKDETVQFVDVTDLMVEFFNPTEDALEMIEEIKATPAVPVQFLTEHD
ncbi:MAG: hypothetical protein KAR44_06090 [Candidatus Aegiribacteria sp.]|nr:hypothetical protein [Candidatus Aegiribacteria sp.]